MGVPYKIEHEGDGFYTIKSVPIFETHNNRGFECDESWMRETIQNFEQGKATGYRPSIIIGHNVQGVEKESYGFLDNFVLRGKRLYADLVRVPKYLKEKIVTNAYPNRSVEVLPQSKRILALALLGGTAPYFSLPQMVYNQNEPSLWYRSSLMALPNENVNVEQIAAAAAKQAVEQYAAQQQDQTQADAPEVYNLTIPQAAELLQANPDAEIFQHEDGKYYCQDENVFYCIPEQIAEYGVAKAASRGFKRGQKAGHGFGGAVKDTLKRHPVATAATAGAAGGVVASRADQKRYQIDENTGIVYFDGHAIGEVAIYSDGVSEVPDATTEQPTLSVDDGATSPESAEETALQSDPGGRGNAFLSPLAEEDSDQFAAQQEAVNYANTEATNVNTAELYHLRQQVDQLSKANELLNVSRKAESYKSYLLSQKKAGAPVGDIDTTVDYLLSQTPEQVKQFQKVLETSPKIQLGAMEYAREIPDQAASKREFNQNREHYSKLGVTDKDLQYADYVRVNTFGAATPATNGNGRDFGNM